MSAPVYEPIDGHPGFYRHGNRVTFRVRDRRGKQRWGSAQSLKEAQRLKVELELSARRGDYHEREAPRFDEYAREWIDSYAGRTSRGISDDTRADYRKRLEREAILFFGRLRLSEIDARDIREFVARIGKRCAACGDLEDRHAKKRHAFRRIAPNTVRLGVAPVRALFATAVEDGLIRSNPTAGLRLAKSDRTSVDDELKALTEAELLAVLAKIPREWRPFFDFLAQTGLRIGEAIELRYGDVELGQRWLHVRRRFYRGRVAKPKSGKSRRIRLTPAVAEMLLEQREARRARDDELIFTTLGCAYCGKADGEHGDDHAIVRARIDPSNLMTRVLKPAAVEAGVGRWIKTAKGRRAETWVGFHTFRHTCATMLFRGGWNAVQVQKFLGHSDPGFTLRTYVHLLPEDLPEPAFLEALCDTSATQPPRTEPKIEADAEQPNPSISSRFPVPANHAEDPGLNF